MERLPTIVEIYERETSPTEAMFRQTVFWSWLIAATGLSRIWFGGALVIDVAAFVLAATWVTTMVLRLKGKTVRLTRSQAVDWVRDGAPADAKTWRANRYG